MSITLNNSDFQCLQDQLVDLKGKNYELAEKNRRGQADFEAAKAKICSLQLKLEEQERDFQIISTTLRREIDSVTGNHGIALTQTADSTNNCETDCETDKLDYKTKFKEISLKNEELEQKNQETLEITQQLDKENKSLTDKIRNVEEENEKLKKEIDVIKKENEIKLSKTIEDIKVVSKEEKDKLNDIINNITKERDKLKEEVVKLTAEVNKFDQRLEVENEERKIQERKGLQMVKELKRQLALEKNRKETLQKRIEHLLSQPPQATISVEATSANNTTQDIDPTQLSASSSANGNGSSNGNSESRANQDTNSVGSWSFVPNKNSTNLKSSNTGLNETISLCSIDSGDRETVQHICDTISDSSMQPVAANISDSASKQTNLSNISTSPNSRITFASFSMTKEEDSLNKQNSSLLSSHGSSSDGQSFNTNNTSGIKGMLLEEQAALVERLTKLQHDKWQLEEKLSYMEQANSSLTEDLANKSDIIKQYFMDQALKAINSTQTNHHFDGNYNNLFNINNNNNNNSISSSRRISFSNNVNQLLTEKPSLKKVVDFLKEKSQSSHSETENISREATKKMQLMLEETLIKCIKLQENLDFVTSELNKIKNQ